MTATAAFVTFCQSMLLPEKARRYEALVSKPRGQKKLLESLCHDFDHAILPNCKLGADYSSIWSCGCFVFIGPSDFGVAYDSFERAYEKLSVKDSWLIIIENGLVGVYRPENRWDSECMIGKP